MRLVHKDNLTYTSKVSQSVISPILGLLFVGGWACSFPFMIEKKFPVFILGVQFFFFSIFAFILLKQFLQLLNHKARFFMAFDQHGQILPMNWAIKTPGKKNDYFIYISTEEIKEFNIIRENKKFDSFDHGKRITHVKNMDYISFKLREDIPPAIIKKHNEIYNSKGFTGSPLVMSKDTIEYTTKGNYFAMKQIEKIFKKKGIYSGKISKRKIHLNNNSDFDEIRNNLITLSQLGDSMDVLRIIKKLEKDHGLTDEQINLLKIDPEISTFKSIKKRT